MIAKVILWKNGVVMAFNEMGEQMTEYQGRLGEVATKVMRDAWPETEFFCGEWNQGQSLITRKEFARMTQAAPDKVIEAVRADLLKRSEAGIKKYGVTLERKDLALVNWLEHAYTECLDQADYLKRAIMELRGEL